MKKLILAALAATTVISPIAAAPAMAQPYRGHGPAMLHDDHRNDRRQAYRNWRRGERFDYRQAQNYRVINDWRSYRGRHLYAPPRGYHWVRSGNDAVLVAITGGLIGAVLAGAFN